MKWGVEVGLTGTTRIATSTEMPAVAAYLGSHGGSPVAAEVDGCAHLVPGRAVVDITC